MELYAILELFQRLNCLQLISDMIDHCVEKTKIKLELKMKIKMKFSHTLIMKENAFPTVEGSFHSNKTLQFCGARKLPVM